MIVRAWTARALAHNVDSYARHFRESVLPELQHIDGHVGALLLKHDRGGHVEIEVLTLWESIDAIRKFAGTPPDRAVVEPAAQAVLESFDATVQHYEVLHSSVPNIGATS